jgi:hypothetical protein
MTIFGGRDASGFLNDVHTLNLVTGAWSGVVSTTGAAPGARNGHTAVAWTDAASAAAKMTIFGGVDATGAFLKDVHTLNLVTNTWSGAVSTTEAAPGARNGHTAVAWTDATSGTAKMTIFGGADATNTILNDVYTLNLATNTWSGAVSTTGVGPSARYGHTAVAWTDAASGAAKMTVFAGRDLTAAFGNFYTLNLATNAWSGAVSMTGAAPSVRRYHTAVAWTDAASGAAKMTIFGGRDATGAFLNNVYTLNLVTNAWIGAVRTTGAAPSGRFEHTAVTWTDVASGAAKMAIFGGRNATGVRLNDVHTLNLATSTWNGAMNTTGAAPSGRFDHTAVVWTDAASGAAKMTIFAGVDATDTSLKDVHTLNLVTNAWSGAVSTTGAAPSKLYGHTAVAWTDAASGAAKMVVFGGTNSTLDGGVVFGGTNAFVHTLNLDSNTWSGVVSTTGAAPSGRFEHSAVVWTDAASGAAKMTIFGGEDAGKSLNDVHTLNLVTNAWSGALSATGAAPSPRFYHTAVAWTDAASGAAKMTIFAGATRLAQNDIHTLDMATGAWSGALLTAGTAPSTRASASAILWSDAASSATRMIIFGGQGLVTLADLHTATLLSHDGALAITNSVTPASLRAQRFGSARVHLDAYALTLRNGPARGTVHGFSGLTVTFSCATHTITSPIVTPLSTTVSLSCATPPRASDVAAGCCALVCSTGACFTVVAPVRFEITGLRLLGGGASGATQAGAAVTIIGSPLTARVALALMHFSALDARALVLESVGASVGATLATSTFEDCAPAGGNGGALLIKVASQLTIAECAFRANRALVGGGGAIAVQSLSSLAMGATNCTGNRARFGGCVDATGAALLAINSSSVIDGNVATDDGGGLRAVFTPLALTSSSLSGNTAGRDGGAMHLSSDVLTQIERTAFTGNRAADGVGGAFCAVLNSPSFSQCTFASNAANATGGLGYVSEQFEASYDACTFEANAPAGTDGKGNVCPAGSASADADDNANCTTCPPDAVAPNAGATQCTPCEESGMQYADGLRMQCAVRFTGKTSPLVHPRALVR